MKYLVIAFLWGANNYTFPVGIFTTEEKAIIAAEKHREFRGGNYDHKVFYISEGKEYDAEDCESFWITGPKKGVND